MPSIATSNHPKRDEILEIASRLFYQQGYGSTGIKQIIDEAAIAKGTFYTHFKSKEELGVEWLRARHIQWNGWLRDAIDQGESSDGKILAAFSFLEDWMKECNYRGCAFLNTQAETPDSSSPMRIEVAKHKRQLHETFQSLVATHYDHRQVGQDFIDQKAGVIFLLFEGALVESQNFQDPLPIIVAQKEVQSMLPFNSTE